LVAILAADIVGYSRLMEEDEAATVSDLKGHQAVILPAVGDPTEAGPQHAALLEIARSFL